jgi:hypothetical protein
MVANNLLKEIYKSEKNPNLVKIITCNKKYAADIKECMSKLSDSLKETLEHLVKHEDGLLMKADLGVQKSEPEVRRVTDTSGTGTKNGSGRRLGVTPTGSTLSASTPQALLESPWERPKARPNFISLDIKEFNEKNQKVFLR